MLPGGVFGRSGESVSDERERGQPDGPPAAVVLDSALSFGRPVRAGWGAGPGATARREPGGVSGYRRAGRVARPQLPAPGRFALLWPQRGRRPALRLSRLEVRRRRQVT